MDRKAIIKAVGITSEKTEDGVKIFKNKKLLFRLERLPSAVRIHYPRGSEAKWTTCHGDLLTDDYVANCMFNEAAREIMNEARK